MSSCVSIPIFYDFLPSFSFLNLNLGSFSGVIYFHQIIFFYIVLQNSLIILQTCKDILLIVKLECFFFRIGNMSSRGLNYSHMLRDLVNSGCPRQLLFMNKEHQQTLYLFIAFVCKRNKDMFTLFIEQLYCILLEDSFHFFYILR